MAELLDFHNDDCYSLEDMAEAMLNDKDTSNVERVQVAQDMLNVVIKILAKVARDTNDEHAKAYMVDHLRIMASNDHGFLSRDFNLDKWIASLENAEAEAEVEEDEEAEVEA